MNRFGVLLSSCAIFVFPSIVSARSATSVAVGRVQPFSNVAPARGHASIAYFCFSTDPKQAAIYFSDVFELPDAGSRADNFIKYERAKIDFQLYLIDNYKYPDLEDLVDCGWMSTATIANASAAMAAKKRSMAAQAVAAKKHIVETGWKNTKAQVAKDSANKPVDDDPIGEGGFITPPTPNKPPKRLD
jgi:hypothetical protein